MDAPRQVATQPPVHQQSGFRHNPPAPPIAAPIQPFRWSGIQIGEEQSINLADVFVPRINPSHIQPSNANQPRYIPINQGPQRPQPPAQAPLPALNNPAPPPARPQLRTDIDEINERAAEMSRLVARIEEYARNRMPGAGNDAPLNFFEMMREFGGRFFNDDSQESAELGDQSNSNLQQPIINQHQHLLRSRPMEFHDPGLDIFKKKTTKVKREELTEEQVIKKYGKLDPVKEEDLTCPVCLMIKAPISSTLMPCKHSFCNECLLMVKDNCCPLCRQEVSYQDADEEYRDKFPYLKIIKKADDGKEYQTTAKEARVNEGKIEELSSGKIPNRFKPNLTMVPKKNLHTFGCTLCPQNNFDRQGLIDHVATRHRQDLGVCPICRVHSYGDPNYRTHLYSHLVRRHSYDMNDLIDDREEEDETLQRIIELSKTVK